MLHGLGVLFNVWMILDGWAYWQMYTLMVFFGFIPFVFEIAVLFAAKNWYRTYNFIERKQSEFKKEKDAEFRKKKRTLEKIRKLRTEEQTALD